jgi:hypothetical protein
MPQLDILEIGFFSAIAAFLGYAFLVYEPEDDADEEDEIQISYLGLRAIQYFEILRASVLLYNLKYYSYARNLSIKYATQTKNVLPFFCAFLTTDSVSFSPLEQFSSDDTLFLGFSFFAAFATFLLEEDDYADDDLFEIIDRVLENIFEDASTALLGC